MSLNSDFKFYDIEDFDSAYSDRLKDFMLIKKNEARNKIILMHLGGIIIECYIKKLIIASKSISKVHVNKHWYDEDTIVNMKADNKQISKKEVKDRCIVNNPGHSLIEGLKEIKGIKDIITKEIESSFNNIQVPLREEDGFQKDFGYIDLRYLNESYISDEKFELWHNDFKIVLNWLIKNSINMEVDN